MPDIEPASYRDIQDAYNQLQTQGHPAVQGMSMHDYAAALNKQTNSNAYDAGLNPNIVKDASAGVDRALDATGVTDLTGGVGKALGGLISPQEAATGEQFGRGIVRPIAAGAAGALVGTLVGGPVGGAAGLEAGAESEGGAMALTAARSLMGSNIGYGGNQALQTYTDTDSVPAAIASGALGYLTHGFGSVGEAAAAKLMGSKLGSVAVGDGTRASVEGVMPTLAEMATEKFGLTAGYAVNNEMTRQAVNVAMGHGLSIPTTSEAVADVAQAAAPLILGVGHDIMGLHDAQQSGRDVRSLSESMNIVQAAQKIATDRVQAEVKQQAVAAEATLSDIKKSDGLRAGAIDMDDAASKVLNATDTTKWNEDTETELAQSPSKTFAGKPLNEVGTSEPLSAPIDRNAQEETPKQPVPNEQAQSQTPPAETTPTTTGSDKQTTPTTDAAVPAGSEPVAPVAGHRQYTSPIGPKPPITLPDLVEKAQLLNGIDKVPSISNFSKLVELHTTFQRQMMDYPELRDQITVYPFSDKYFLAQVEHFMSPEGGSMKSGPALNQVLQAAKNHLADKITDFAAKRPVIDQTRIQENDRLRVANKAKFVAENADKEKVANAKQIAQLVTSQAFVENAKKGKWARVITAAQEKNPGVLNSDVAIERWVRKIELNQSPDARDALQEITDQQKAKMRRLTPEEMEAVLNDKDRTLDDRLKDHIRFVFNDSGLMWTKTGEISKSSKMGAILQDNPKNPDHGMWNASLDQYMKASAKREDEEVQEDGHVSLDATHDESGGESTLAHTDLGDEIGKAARARHAKDDPISVQTAVSLGERRVAALKDINDRVAKMSVEELRRIVLNARFVVPTDLERFQVLLQTFFRGMQIEPHELQAFIRTKVPTRLRVGGRQLELPPGLSNWLREGEKDSHTAWISVGKTNMGEQMKKCLAFYHEFVTIGPDNMPEVNPKYKDGIEVDKQASPMAVDKKGFVNGKLNFEQNPTEWSDEERNSATTFARPDVENQLALGAHSWFTEYLKKLGVDPQNPLFARYRDSMVRTALLFPQIERTRIGGIASEAVNEEHGQTTAGVMHSKFALDGTGQFSLLKRFVNLAGEKYSAPWVAAFLQNMVAAHEFNHVIFDAHEMGELGDDLSVKMDDALATVKDMSPEDREQILNTLKQFMIPKEIRDGNTREGMEIMKRLSQSTRYGVSGGRILEAQKDDPEEFLSTMFEYLGVGLSNPGKSTENLKNFERLRQYIPDRLREFQEAYYTNLLQYTKALQGFMNEYTPGLGDKYAAIAKLYEQLARTPEEVSAAMSALHTMQALQPEQFIQLANDAKAPDAQIEGLGTDKYSVKFAKDAKVLYGLKGGAKPSIKEALEQTKAMLLPDPKKAPDYGHDPGFWSLFTPLAQFAERYPVMRPLADTLLSFDGMVNSSNALALSPFGMRSVGGKLVKTESLDALKRLTSSPQTHNLLNKVFLWQNRNSRVMDEATLNKLAPTLSTQQREDVMSALSATRDSLQTVGAGTITNSLQMSGHLIGSLSMAMEKDMTAKTGEQVGVNLMNALVGMQSKDPAVADQAMQLLGGVKMQLDPETWVHVLQLGQTLSTKHSALVDNLTNRPFYTPETRPHEFGLYYEKDGQPQFFSYKNESEAMKERDRVSKLANVQKVGLTNPYDRSAPGAQYSEAAVNHFVSLEQDAFKAAQQVFSGTPEGLVKMQEFAKLYSPGTAILDELGNKGIRKNLQERKFVGGREDIDMLSNALNYVNSMTRANAKNYIRSKTLLQSQDPTLVNEPRLKGLFFDHMNNVLNPPSQSLSALKHLTTMYYIGGNFSSAAMQAFQPIQATLPHLTRNGVGIVQGLKYFGDACGTLFNAYGRGKGIQGDPVLQAAFNKATTERVVGFQNVMSQFDHFDDAFVSRVKNFANDAGDASMTPSKLLQNVSYQTTRVLSYMFQHVTEHNTRVSFIAGFNAARDQGKAKGLVGKDLSDYAYGEAKRTVEESLHTGGQASRPLGFGQVGKLYGVAGNLYALNHFNFSMISIMARYGLEAIGHTGLEGAALHNARKAFGQALVTQLTLGGAMGLPFAGAAVAMLEELFPNLQLNRDMRSAISGLAGDDHELGGFLADASLKGLATAASPVDVSGRLGLSAVLGEDPYYGFEAKDLLGATGSMLYNMTKGVQGVAQGDPSAAVKFMPNALQRVYQAAHDGGIQRNAQGQPIFQPTDTERMLMAIGLRPKALSHVKEQSMIDERDQTIQSRELQRWYMTQEAALTSGNFAAVKDALYQKAQEDPTFSPVIALKRIAAGAQKSQVTQSPVDRGSASELRSREAIGQTFGQPTTSQQQPTQVEQLLQRTQLEREVGIPGAGQVAQTEMSQARLMDYLMQRYNLDDAQARAIISQMSQQKNPQFRAAHPGLVSPLAALTAQRN